MNTGVVFGQMLVLLSMMAVGFWCYKKGWITDESSGHFSKLVVNVFNPVLVVNGVLGQNSSAAGGNIGYNLMFIVLYFGLLCVVGLLMPVILRVQAGKKSIYQLMTIFSNVGFMGIPVIRSIFGNEAMIYVAFYILAYNIMLYTCGMHLAKKAGEEYRNRPISYLEAVAANSAKSVVADEGLETDTEENISSEQQTLPQQKEKVSRFRAFFGQMLNPGVVAALLAVVIFASGVTLPEAVCSFCDYMGNTTIPLSMLLIGVSIAQANLREVFVEWRVYVFVLLRMVLLPVGMIFLLNPIVKNFAIEPVVFGIFIIELGMPVGSIIALMTREQGGDVAYCTKGVVLSTLASIITIPLICTFL